MSGVSYNASGVILHLSDRASAAQIAQAEQIVADHDPSVLTSDQQAAVDRSQRLAQMRADNAADLDVNDFSSEAAAIQDLAAKIAWLEQEVRELSGG